MAISANRLELLHVADAVANEKGIDIEVVNSALEAAFQKAARSRYGMESDLKAELNSDSGEIRLTRHLHVVEEVENTATEITLDTAMERKSDAKIGDVIIEELPPMDFGRVAAQSAKQVIIQMVRDAEREQQFEDFKDRVGQLIHGVVKRLDYGNVYVDLGRGEAIIRRDQLIPKEVFRVGDRTRAYIYDVKREQRGPQIFLSRIHNEFLANLFASEVPEIYDGVVQIHAVARDPGSRAKIAVSSNDSSIDPVGACVGHRGMRVQAVVNELQNEKIDIISWSPDLVTYISNTLQPADVTKVMQDVEKGKIEVVVTEETLPQAIGRRGQNVRLASKLTGLDIDIMTEVEESERRQREFAERTKLFIEALNVDEMVGQLLAAEEFSSVEELLEADNSEFMAIEGFDDATVENLKARAQEHLEEVEEKNVKECKKLGVSDDLRKVDGMKTEMMVALGNDGVRSLEDFAGCAVDDLMGWNEKVNDEWKRIDGTFSKLGVTKEESEKMIMQARVLAGLVDAADLVEPEEPESTESESETADEAETVDEAETPVEKTEPVE